MSTIAALWQQYSPLAWNEMYNEYVSYTARMTEISASDGPFTLLLRMYVPQDIVVKGQYQVPPATLIS